MTSRALDAINLVRPPPKRPRVDGLKRLKSRAKLRAAALVWRRINFAFLIVSFCLLLWGDGSVSALPVALFALAAILFERMADGPPQRRRSKIVRDRRPVLLKTVLVVPTRRREGRITALPAAPIILALPPSRPRSRAARRETAIGEDSE